MARIDHINLTVTDLDKSIQWYGDLFGFEKVEGGVTPYGILWAIISHNDSMIAMSEYAQKKSADLNDDRSMHRVFHFGIRVDDDVTWREKIKRFDLKLYYGGEIEYPHSRSWYVHDPSGHEIEVSWSNGKPLRFDKSS